MRIRGAEFSVIQLLCMALYYGCGQFVPGRRFDVMIGPNLCILPHNHHFERTDITMREQGIEAPRVTRIEDDVWIGRNVIMTPGRTVRRGTIIGAGCVLTKDFEPYSIVGGNPSRLIRKRKEEV